MPEQKTIQTEPIVDKTYMYVRVKNNTSAAQNIVLFDLAGAFNSQNAINGTTTFSVNLTTDLAQSISKGLYTVAILAIPFGGSTYQLYTSNNVNNAPFQNINEVVNTLNNLSIGIFYVVSGNTIAVQGKGYYFSNISLTRLYVAAHDTGIFGNNYTVGGSLIYDPGYSVGLVGNFTQINLANAFWKNTLLSFNGPFNRSNIYANNAVDIDLSFFANINMSQPKTVYLGISTAEFVGFNQKLYFQLYVNGVLTLDLSTNASLLAMATNVNSILGTAYTADEISFICWHILPIALVAGNNIIQAIILGNDGVQVDVIGLEVYDNTPIEIQNATSYSELNVLFSSIQYSGKLFF